MQLNGQRTYPIWFLQGKKTKRHQGIKGSKNQLKQAKNILDRFISSATTADQKKAGYLKNLRKNIIVQTVERSLC